MKMSENHKQELMKMFKNEDGDLSLEYRKKVNTAALLQELEEAMEECDRQHEARIQKERTNVINSLTDKELGLILDLYGQKLFSMYEKKNDLTLNCIVR